MPSPKIIELEQILQTYSIEDKQWLLQQLIQQLGLDNQEKPPVNYKQQAKEIIAETISEVLALSNDCEEEAGLFHSKREDKMVEISRHL